MVVAEAEHVPLDDLADLRAERRRVVDEREAVDRVEVELLLEEDDELAVGLLLVLARIESAPYSPPRIDVSIDGEWSW